MSPAPARSHVALVGMPGTGKSATAAALASLLGIDAFDLDGEIESRSGRAVADILRVDGEAALRHRECEVLEVLLASPPGVIACGAGAVTSAPTRRLLTGPGVTVVWLTASESTLRDRLARNGQDRPLVDDPSSLERMWLERRVSYLTAADLVVATDARAPDEVARTIAARNEVSG